MINCFDVRRVEWPAFLAQHDPLWTELPQAWDEGPFMGNGMLGSMLYYDPATEMLRLDINSTEVQDHRQPITHSGIDNSRLPVGHFVLRTAGCLTGVAMRLDLYNAVCFATLETTRGTISVKAYTHSLEMVFVVETQGTEGEREAEWEFVSEEAFSVRQAYGLRTKNESRFKKDYNPNPKGCLGEDGAEHLWLQPLRAGGGTATAWSTAGGRLVASIAFDRCEVPTAKVIETVRRNMAIRSADLLLTHENWWHEYYPASFVTIPDARLESFYWIQMYKIACATRANTAMVDNNGPWLQDTPWSYATWNLNVQLTYWCTIASNRATLVNSLLDAIHNHRQQLIDNCELPYRHDSATLLRTTGIDLCSPANAPDLSEGATGVQTGLSSAATETRAPPEVGNLPWALHDCWLAFKHTMNLDMLRDKLYPMLRRTTNYYLHFLVRGDDGKLHLPSTYSPEYASVLDSNYNLALLRWSCTALLEAIGYLDIKDDLAVKWTKVLQDLVEYPVDDEMGWLIGDNFPLKESHRHYSHMLQAYPLYLVNRAQGKAASEVIQKTLDHWQSMPEKLRGYSCTGASSISSALGKGDDALAYLSNLFDDFIRPNTMYKEDGPVIETPLSGAQSILDMLCQSWGGVVRPFPAMPSSWDHALFADLTAEGGFVVGARWERGKTAWVSIYSRAGQPLFIETDITTPMVTVCEVTRPAIRNDCGLLMIDLKEGETAVICPTGSTPDFSLILDNHTGQARNVWGMNPNSLSYGERDSHIDG